MSDILNILFVLVGAVGFAISLRGLIAVSRTKNYPSKETCNNEIRNIISSGVDISHGMIRNDERNGVIADSRLSTTYIKSHL